MGKSRLVLILISILILIGTVIVSGSFFDEWNEVFASINVVVTFFNAVFIIISSFNIGKENRIKDKMHIIGIILLVISLIWGVIIFIYETVEMPSDVVVSTNLKGELTFFGDHGGTGLVGTQAAFIYYLLRHKETQEDNKVKDWFWKDDDQTKK